MSQDQSASRPDRRRHPRHSFRSRSHASAHAAEHEPASPLPEHEAIPRGAAALITTPPALAELAEHIRSQGSFAYDSEFIGELSYLPKLCLLQVATRQRVALIDPLAGLDLAPLWELMADPQVEKIVHAGDQDLEPVHRLVGRRAANIFDTQIAAGMAALAYPVALSKLVRELLNVRLGKGFTFTHWDQRPLSSVQLRYAADDVRFLPAARDELARRLEAMGHLAWAKEECESLCDPAKHEFDPRRDFLRLRGAGSLTARQLSVLRELMAWRDVGARQSDLPPRSFVKDEILVDMARNPIGSVADLAKVRGLPRPVEQAHGQAILQATQQGLATPMAEMPVPRQGEESPADRFRIDSLWTAIQTCCFGQGIDPSLVSSRADVAAMWSAMENGKLPPDAKLMRGWRRAAAGDWIASLVQGQQSIRVNWHTSGLVARPQS